MSSAHLFASSKFDARRELIPRRWRPLVVIATLTLAITLISIGYAPTQAIAEERGGQLLGTESQATISDVRSAYEIYADVVDEWRNREAFEQENPYAGASSQDWPYTSGHAFGSGFTFKRSDLAYTLISLDDMHVPFLMVCEPSEGYRIWGIYGYDETRDGGSIAYETYPSRNTVNLCEDKMVRSYYYAPATNGVHITESVGTFIGFEDVYGAYCPAYSTQARTEGNISDTSVNVWYGHQGNVIERGVAHDVMRSHFETAYPVDDSIVWRPVDDGFNAAPFESQLSYWTKESTRFTPGRNGNAFIHSNGYGCGFEGISNHALAQRYLDNLLQGSDVSLLDRWSVTWHTGDEWEGSCHGIAATMMMLYEGSLEARDLRAPGSTATVYAQMGRPSDNENLLNAIEYYQLSQYVDSYDSKTISEVYPAWWSQRGDFVRGDYLSTLLRLMYVRASEGTVTCLSFGHDDSGHTVLATDAGRDSNGYWVRLYDSNSARAGKPGNLATMRITDDFEWFSFTDANGNDINNDTYKYLTLRGAPEFEGAGKGVSGLSRQNDDGTMLVFRSGYPVKVTDSTGRYLTFDADGKLAGNITVNDISFAETDESYELFAWTDAEGELSLSAMQDTDSVRFAVSDDGGFVGVEAQGAASASLSSTGDIELAAPRNRSAEFRIFASLNDDEDFEYSAMASCKGVSDGKVSASRHDEKLFVRSDDEMSDVETRGYVGSAFSSQEVSRIAAGDAAVVGAPEPLPMHRLYNPWSGEHFYTSDDTEHAHLVSIGWNDEGIGWIAPVSSTTPVFRLYNRYAPGGEHHYTIDEGERDGLIEAGWTYEGIGWYSDDDESIPLFREYNPYEFSNNHNYTADDDEHDFLINAGWRDEGIAWYGI